MSATSSRQRPLLYAGFGPLSGFPETESLTGFLSRLCAARGILITDALDHLVRPLVPPGIVPPRRDLSKLLKRAIVRYDGMGPSAAHVACALEHLTGVSGLAYLTFVPWQCAFSASSTGAVLMHGKRWCARCFASWHEQGLPFYEPLLWRLAPVVRCPEHRVRLSDRCPSCGRAPRLVTQTVPPGHSSVSVPSRSPSPPAPSTSSWTSTLVPGSVLCQLLLSSHRASSPPRLAKPVTSATPGCAVPWTG